MFTPSDLAQLEARGISVEKAEKQLQSFATGFPELDIVSAASVGNGVLNPTEEEIDAYVKAWQDYLDERTLRLVQIHWRASSLHYWQESD